MRFWQNFRDPRTAAAFISALLAFAFAILDLRALFMDALSGTAAPESVQASTMAVGIAALAGALLSLRRGNLVFLLVAWAFVLGNKFTALVRFLEELSSAGSQPQFMLAVLGANLDLILAIIGAVLAFASTFLRRRARRAQA
jgi:hypothetical protein